MCTWNNSDLRESIIFCENFNSKADDICRFEHFTVPYIKSPQKRLSLQSDVTLSQSSTYISSTDASISPGQLINSFGEFKISKHIRDKINQKSNSLSEGKVCLLS